MTRTPAPVLVWIALSPFGCAGSPPGALQLPGEEATLEECSDLADNDGDGLADCRDPACGAYERCSDDFDPDQDPDGLEPADPDAPPGDDVDPAVPDDDDVPEPAPACEAEACVAAGGSHCCDGECINYYIDLDNCGACGAECVRGVCAASFCMCGDPWPDMCGSYETGHLCTDFATDRDNCGGCGQACAAGQSCCAGLCADAC